MVKQNIPVEVKQNIKVEMENGIREMCHNLSKSRSILNDKYELKKYLKEMSVEEAKQVLRMRLHMVDLPCNYGGGESAGCVTEPKTSTRNITSSAREQKSYENI